MQSGERQESPARAPTVDSEDGQEPQKKKQRRSKAGCLTCRTSRKGCDEVKPRCGRCTRLSYTCIWPEAREVHPSPKSRISKERLDAAEKENQFHMAPPAFTAQSRMYNAPSASASAPPTPLAANASGSTRVMPATASPPLFQSIHNGTNVLHNPYGASYSASHDADNRSIGIPDSLVRSFQPPPTPLSQTSSSTPSFNSNNTFGTDSIMPFATESPSTAMSANFWDDHQLYGLDYDYRELDSLLALMGQTTSGTAGTSSSLLPGPPTTFPAQTGQGHNHLLPNSHLQTIQDRNGHSPQRSQPRQDQLVLPRDKLKAMSKFIPKRCYAFLERMVEEQDNGKGEATLPIAYLINLAMWTPPTIIEDLVAQAKEIYIQGSPLRHFIEEIDEAIWPILLSKPTKAVKLSITLEQIVNLKDVSFHTKIYALMDMAYHNLYVAGASAFYSDLSKIADFVKKYFKKPNQVIDLAKLGNKKDFGIAVFVYADILASIALGRPTTFPVTYTQDVNDPEQMRYVIGIEHLLCIAADIATFKFALDRDYTSRIGDGNLNPLYKAQADRLLWRIRTSTCCLPFEEEDDSVHYLSLLAAQELWRQAILCCFYQSIYKLPNTDVRLIKCMKQIMELWRSTRTNGGEPDMLKMAATAGAPLFLACTVAREQKDIDVLRGYYEELESTCAADVQIKDFVEALWAEQQRLGSPVDWHDYASEERGPAFP